MTLDGASLVTGALGQDGFILCRRLRELGAEVVGVARPGHAHAARRDVLLKTGCRIVDLDLHDTQGAEALVAEVRPNHIFHLAAAHHPAVDHPETPETWRSMLAINVVATEALARAAVSAGLDCSFVYASSSQIWTARGGEQRVDERTPAAPTTFYGLTKAWASDLLRQYRQRHGLRAMVTVLFNHESPWRGADFVTRRISMAAARAAAGDKTKLQLANIGARVDWQAAADVVEALLLMAKSKPAEDYVLASGRSRSVRDFAATAYRHAGLDWQDHVWADLDEQRPHLTGAPDKAMRQLGWRPQHSFEDVVRGMVDADVERLRSTSAIP
jgi:GDPmannose 4,6-dehydratase